MTDLQAIRKALNEEVIYPPEWQIWAKGIEIILAEMLNAIQARDEKIAELERDIRAIKTMEGNRWKGVFNQLKDQ